MDLSGRDFDAVIFDMDGTLIDSTPAVLRAWTRWALEEQVSAEMLAGQHGVPAAAVIRAVLPVDRHHAALERITRLELDDLDDVVPLPGAVEAFEQLPVDRVAIATSCTTPLAAARLDASGLGTPKVLVTVDDVEHGKPHPEPYLTAAARLGFAPQRCLVVEDAPKGLQAGQAAGSPTLAVVTTTPRHELVADLVVDDLAQVSWTVDGESGRIRIS
jgi:sugar-phosphatase